VSDQAALAAFVAAMFALQVTRSAVVRRRTFSPWVVDAAVVLAVFAVAATLERAMGRQAMCACGTFRLWVGDVWSAENSQQLTDPYSFTHVEHGILFYWLLRAIAPRMSLGRRLALALSIEAAWEVAENTNTVIQRYREATVSLLYDGDTVLNTLGDLLCCLLGFGLASRLPGRLAFALVVVTEVALAIWIRDGLLLNVLMLLYPIEAVRRWQLGDR
jgi:uncharacterized membrane protein YjdF